MTFPHFSLMRFITASISCAFQPRNPYISLNSLALIACHKVQRRRLRQLRIQTCFIRHVSASMNATLVIGLSLTLASAPKISTLGCVVRICCICDMVWRQYQCQWLSGRVGRLHMVGVWRVRNRSRQWPWGNSFGGYCVLRWHIRRLDHSIGAVLSNRIRSFRVGIRCFGHTCWWSCDATMSTCVKQTVIVL
jgi:hypothetical protein